MIDSQGRTGSTPGRLRYAIDSSHHVLAGPQQRGTPEDVQTSIDDYVRLAQVADRAGIDSFWAIEEPNAWDAVAMLSVLARETDRIRLGPGVLNPYYRHPALIAASVSTLDAISDGRAFLGLGRGQPEWYEHSLGMDIGSPLATLEESFQLLRQWFSPHWHAEASPEATRFPVREWQRVTGPVQSHMPIYLAAAGPKALSFAARYADGVIFNNLTSLSFMERTINDVRAQAAAEGRDPHQLSFFARSNVTITDDPEVVHQRGKNTVAMIHALPGMERLLESPGFDTEAIVAKVREDMRTDEVLARGGNFTELRRAGDIEAARRHIPTELMRELVVAGPVDEVRVRLRRMREIGVTDVFLARPRKGQPAERLIEIVNDLSSV